MGEAILAIAAALCIYPLAVLVVAITGPHSRFEQEERGGDLIHYQHGFGPGDGPSKVIEGESK